MDVNEVAKEMRQSWRSGWVRCDPRNSFEEPAEFTDKAAFDAYWEQVKDRGEREEFYECPLCGQISNDPIRHLLDSTAHDDVARQWKHGNMTFARAVGESGFDPLTIKMRR